MVIADAGDAGDARAREKAREFGEGTFEASFPMEGAKTDAAKAMRAGGGPVCSPVVADREVCRDFLKVRLFLVMTRRVCSYGKCDRAGRGKEMQTD